MSEVVTVEQRDILSKLGANDRTHAVAIAITLGMLRLELPSDDLTDGSESLGLARKPHTAKEDESIESAGVFAG
jgi:hypothetical protein